VEAVHGDTSVPVTPRVVIAYYYHTWDNPQRPPGHWGVAVGPEHAGKGIDYPARVYWSWGMLPEVSERLFLVHTINEGVCVLAEGYRPYIDSGCAIIAAEGYPRCYRREKAETARDNVRIPEGCKGVWHARMTPRDSGFLQKAEAAHMLCILPTLDAALASSPELAPDDRRWAYARLLDIVQEFITEWDHGDTRLALERWKEVLRKRAGIFGERNTNSLSSGRRR
jgi:hypothetical protein